MNDGSRDATLSILQALRSRFPDRIRVLDKQPNGGKAEAVRHGMLHAIDSGACEITGFWDADLATPLAQIPDLTEVLLRDAHLTMVFGARVRLLGRNIHRQPVRHYLGRCFATTAAVLLRLPIYDTQCGAKLFRATPELREVLAAPFQMWSCWRASWRGTAAILQPYETASTSFLSPSGPMLPDRRSARSISSRRLGSCFESTNGILPNGTASHLGYLP